MPFCTACGKQNPDDARFCSQCGTRLVTDGAEAPTGTAGSEGAAGASDATATITFGVPTPVDTSDRKLSPVDAAAVDALPGRSRAAHRAARPECGQPVPARRRPDRRWPTP
ncbi:zinc-ribbon domain-containing protein [Nocardioides sp. B-3]|uniref:zinc-ribbon domain-containing protein n=1 Tax=Nocardioides sp. B-3 TaxID=2895565 RepID=UPI003FA608F7